MSKNNFQDLSKDNGSLNKLLKFKDHFERFLWDILSVILVTTSLLILVGNFGLSEGIFLSKIISLIKIWFGWGTYYFILTGIIGGYYAYRHGRNKAQLNWKQIIYIEFIGLLSLGVLSIMGGNSVELMSNGAWGGRIGWGLVTLAEKLTGKLLGNILLIAIWFILLMAVLDFWNKLESWLKIQSGQIDSITFDQIKTLDPSPQRSLKGGEDIPTQKPTIKTFEPEYKKKLQISKLKDEKPKTPQHRDENLPSLSMLASEQFFRPDDRNINQTAGLIEKTLSDFGIPARVVGFRVGPTITQFAVEPGFIEKGGQENGDPNRQKVRIAQIAGLSRDLALALSAERLRIEAPVPGKSYVGIEVPNAKAINVRLRPILESNEFFNKQSPLTIALGRDVSGHPLVADLSRMPHLLIAGTTGSGKSVCISAIATCLAVNNSPTDLRLVMIDSKMVELIRFNGLPHLYGKVETDLQRILGVLRWIVSEMEHRYRLLESARVRDIEGYNRRILRRKEGDFLPRIVLLIDELADLMMSAPDQTEHNLVRLAQMARATGIHLVVATQRPSTDVVTGLIKANFPARISFAVASGIDSRVILDSTGAETLLGHGDMLFLNPEVGNSIRAQGVLISDQEIEHVISFWQKSDFRQEEKPPWDTLLFETEYGEDGGLIDRAITLLKKEQRASVSLLQRRLRIGYPRAARLLDKLEEMGIVGPASGGGRDRDVLVDPDQEQEDSFSD